MIDPVTLSILDGRLSQIADEMDATLYRAAFNPIIAEARDACHGLYHATTGDTLVQGASGLPIFVGAMAFAVRAVIEKVAKDGGLEPGDTFLFNDPYAGGTHLNDFRLVRPVFRDGVFVLLDRLGRALAGYRRQRAWRLQSAGDGELSGESVRFPPVKLISAGRMNGDILDILAANARVPASNYGDLQGQLGALDLGERRLAGLLDEYGTDVIAAAFDALADRAEALMRAAVTALPDGKYSFEDVLDNDGITADRLTVALDLTIAGGEMAMDFSRSSPPCAGPVNISYATTIAACYVALKHVFTAVPANAGCLRPIRFVVPPTTLLAATAPKPMAGYTETILRLIGVVLGALAQADPARATAAPFGTINALSLAGHRGDGSRWVMFSFFGGGMGGNPESDGLNHANNPISTATIPPLEILEAAYPVVFHQWALRPGSGGEGAHRGGLGAVYEIETLTDAQVALLGERGTVAPFGVVGGGPGALNRFTWQTAEGERSPPLVSKVTGVQLAAGRRVRLETPGGGGWGNPSERDPAAAERDRALGYVL